MTMTADTTTTTDDRIPGKGEVQVMELVTALTAVIPHANPDSTLPMIHAVKFQTTDENTLTIVATDRYSLATYRMDWKGGEVDALLNLTDAKALLAYAKKGMKGMPVFLTFTANELEAFDYERRVSYRLMDMEFVRWQAILPALTTDGEVNTIGINPHLMAKFAKASPTRRPEPMRLNFTNRLKPVRVDIGEKFTGLIMPVRIGDDVRR